MNTNSKIDVGKLQAPTAIRLWEVDSPFALQIRGWVEDMCKRAPDTMQKTKENIYGREGDFKGAIWEFFWWEILDGSCSNVDVEGKVNQDSIKSVDFIADFPSGKRIALEITTLSDHFEDIQRDYELGKLQEYLEGRMYGPYRYIHMNPVKFALGFNDYALVSRAILSWIDEVAYTGTRHAQSEPMLRLNVNDSDVVLDFKAMGLEEFSRERPSILRSSAEKQEKDEKQRLRCIVMQKAKKKEAVPDLPFVVAVTEVGNFMSGSLWSRANALIGDEQIGIHENSECDVVHSNNGIFVGAEGWRNPEISALILSAATLPEVGLNQFEIWLHGGATHPMEPEDFGFDVRYFRIGLDRVEEFQGFSSAERWVSIPIR